MKRQRIAFCLAFALALTACGGTAATPSSTQQPAASGAVSEAAPPQTPETPTENAPTEAGDNILIAYFTWAENTQVDDPAAVDVDATASASVLLPGNTAKLAGWVQQRVGGDLFSIVVTDPYSSDYDECLARASDEKSAGTRLELTNHVENMADYDVIFLGYPNWWYGAPMAVISFLEEYDLTGKTIVPFCAHGTGGLANSIAEITAALPADAAVLEPIGVYRPDIDTAQPRINEWLDSLG